MPVSGILTDVIGWEACFYFYGEYQSLVTCSVAIFLTLILWNMKRTGWPSLAFIEVTCANVSECLYVCEFLLSLVLLAMAFLTT